MANIAIYVSGQHDGLADGYRLSGEARVAGRAGPLGWITADITWRATAADVNQAIQDAATAAAREDGYQIDTLDSKTIIGSGATITTAAL